ncbi:hypothetical protein FNJ88_07145 [Chryseobacterium sp. SNU WT5]|uniref:hypothetical protein n=1 Tax=Chryseobacterium sp. SNU WT5 TaxID=2594269 RepID=UPI00117E25B0|nr:hypothetical protein [Chryseobacterium sp. SNU WT5]QDP85350.1 hypothetical protein FNJ88_07145 [Chryseobacterium sp. SNU WT5]
MKKQPYYMIDFSASACLFEIRINDYPVIHMNVEGQVASMIPINYAILESGVQSLSVSILPNVGDLELHKKSEVNFNIKLFDTANDFIFEEQFGEYHSKAVEDKKIPIIKYSNSFEANVPYSLEAWQKGINLKDIDDCRKKLESTYEKIANIIKNNEFDLNKKLISKREENMAISMYLSKDESANRVDDLIKDFESGFEIQPIPEDAVMVYCADNKVAMLKKPNGEPALFLENKETEEELMLDLAFYIPVGKTEFEII